MRITQLLGLLLLGVSIALEVVTNVVRFVFFVFVLLTISYRLPSVWLALLILGWPVIAALATLVGWPGGALMRWEYGARRPSTRERASMDAAAARLGGDRVRLPRRWYVIDAPLTNASVVGSTLFVTRELVNSPFLDEVLAE